MVAVHKSVADTAVHSVQLPLDLLHFVELNFVEPVQQLYCYL